MIEQCNTIIQGDALEVLKTLPDSIVQTCVTSPPYYGLRDYGTAQWTGGNPECDHINRVMRPSDRSTLERHGTDGRSPQLDALPGIPYSQQCGKCGATRIDQQIGLEESPEAYIARLVEVFREVKRVLRDDGTLWVNIGDSYAGSWGNYAPGGIKGVQRSRTEEGERWERKAYQDTAFLPPTAKPGPGYKPKDLLMIPAQLALALRADGWYLRSDIIWAKSNCMPESVTDRPTKAHEYIFLLSKSERYFYDQDAIREAQVDDERTFYAKLIKEDHKQVKEFGSNSYARTKVGFKNATYNPAGRNKRSVWTVPTFSFPGSHFATFPPKLIEPCILAGSHPGDIVLDPFSGAGTALMVASQLGRSWLGIELNPEYIALARERMSVLQVNLWEAVS